MTSPISYLPKSIVDELCLEESMEQLSIQSKSPFQGHQVKAISCAHLDDIHGLIKLKESHFLTGSKDGEIHKRTLDGTLEKKILTANQIDYKKWVTSLAPIDENRWASGFRNGNIQIWDVNGSLLQSLKCKTPKTFHCKQQNNFRINCITALSSNILACGIASCFFLYHLENNQMITHCQTSQNDWVYCIKPLQNRQLLVVTGTELEIYKLVNPHWKKISVIHSQNNLEPNKQQRPFISAITPLHSNSNHLALSLFDGSIRIRDLSTSKEIQAYEEHIGRTWAIVNIANSYFASCGDDGKIKIWDPRESKRVLTLSDLNGRISCLLPINENALISTSCKSDVHHSTKKGQISFWDIR